MHACLDSPAVESISADSSNKYHHAAAAAANASTANHLHIN
jgi:hypothetical protein